MVSGTFWTPPPSTSMTVWMRVLSFVLMFIDVTNYTKISTEDGLRRRKRNK